VNDVVWELAHAVDVRASPAFAWNLYDERGKLDDPPATFQLDGSFRIGSSEPSGCQGKSLCTGNTTSQSTRAYTLEMALDRAVWSFEWRSTGSRRANSLTPAHCSQGENAAAYLAQVQPVFTLSLQRV